MSISTKVSILIPAYEPDETLVNVVSEVNQSYPVIVVNDGSSATCKAVLDKLAAMENVVILNHPVNLGKGQALKTGFNHILVNHPEMLGVVTADADGQHLVRDIVHIAEKLSSSPKALHIGVRDFDRDIPFRSKLGNKVTQFIFKFFSGKQVSDTQTGLRGIPVSFMPELLKIKTSGYDFELEMLLLACRTGIELIETKIETVYEEGNKSSHFNPVIDSVKIYYVFIRFSAVSIASALIDYLVFSISWAITGNILLSTVYARLLAGTFNFLLGKKAVFRSGNKMLPEAVKYILLAVVLMFISYGLVENMVTMFGVNVFLAKIVAEGTLFLASFAMQRIYVFSGKKGAYETN